MSYSQELSSRKECPCKRQEKRREEKRRPQAATPRCCTEKPGHDRAILSRCFAADETSNRHLLNGDRLSHKPCRRCLFGYLPPGPVELAHTTVLDCNPLGALPKSRAKGKLEPSLRGEAGDESSSRTCWATCETATQGETMVRAPDRNG